jgi:hypothetical protein
MLELRRMRVLREVAAHDARRSAQASARADIGALPLSICRGSIVPCMIRGIGDRGELLGGAA